MNIKRFRMRTKYSSLFTLVLVAIAFYATGCKPKFEEADKLFKQGYYRQSAIIFEEFSKSTKDKKLKSEAIFFAAEAYRLSDEYDKALIIREIQELPNHPFLGRTYTAEEQKRLFSIAQ